MRRTRKIVLCFALFLPLFTLGCQIPPRVPPASAAAYADMNPSDLRHILALLARSHDQKLQLTALMNLPLVGAETPAKPVFTTMSEVQSALGKELAAWAKDHEIDLTFQFPDDIQNQAQKKMEDRQGNVILGDNRTDRTRDTLIQMSLDYEWQICLIETLLPKVYNPSLRQYLDHSLKAHQEGSTQLRDMLKRYKLS